MQFRRRRAGTLTGKSCDFQRLLLPVSFSVGMLRSSHLFYAVYLPHVAFITGLTGGCIPQQHLLDISKHQSPSLTGTSNRQVTNDSAYQSRISAVGEIAALSGVRRIRIVLTPV